MQSIELHIYTDFLRIVLEIIIAILTYALPRNPEVCIGLQFSLLDRRTSTANIFLQVVYAVLHRQEVFEPFKNHPRFSELLENIYTVCYRLSLVIFQKYTILFSRFSSHCMLRVFDRYWISSIAEWTCNN